MWVRNGNQLRVQAIIYAQPHINASFQTPDLDLIRYCGANVDPDWFIDALLHNFHLVDVFRFPVINKELASSNVAEVTPGQPDVSENNEKIAAVGTGRATPDEIADANWERCAEQIKVILKDLPPGKADVVMAALHARSGDNLVYSKTNPPYGLFIFT
ncbi:hypothetical protein ANCDUO_13936 [Ancylostoma duodenale]|uniref:E3 ubiquitin-protein ligase n=1 Tax=Ancylostoma duodenale TaxID=51022 RepID=A0A0C2GFL3_9BILA|nr:hypothetical protein ANCDUO_13936 [Ancylostoma duodenale]